MISQLQWATGARRNNKKRHLDSMWTITGEKRIKLLHDLLLKCTECSQKTQTRNPGFGRSQTRVLGLAKWLGSPGPGYFKTWVSIQSLVRTDNINSQKENVQNII